MDKKITIALAGNPNSGKTTIFNNITGAHQHVGNWPGVTVEKKVGTKEYQGYKIDVVDLPGVYSLTAYSPDEMVSRNFIVDEKPDAVVNTVDASSLERNLYLTVQMLEMGAPLIIALNMMDMVEANGYHIDIQALSKEIGAKVVPMTASHNMGTKDLLEEVIRISQGSPPPFTFKLNYGNDAETEINKLEAVIANSPLSQKYSPRWLAVKLLEQDEDIIKKFRIEGTAYEDIEKTQNESLAHLRSIYNDDAESIIADARYGFISGLLKDILKKPPVERLTLSDNIDKILINRWLGIPVLFFVMFLLFQFVFTLSGPLMDWIGKFFSWFGGYTARISPDWLGSLLTDGVIGGVGTVLTFVPPIFLMFIAISILEDCGYMARAAFVTDKFMHRLGLHGRSFIPSVLGFGCNVAGVMACRTIENPRDRLTTILINPFMSCGGKLPIYILLAGAFFPKDQGIVVFGMYMIGVIVAVIAAFILRKTLLKGPSSHFVMELPPYRWPTIKGVITHMWQRGKHFLSRAGTLILGIVVIVWFLSSMPWGVEYASSESIMGSIGSFVAPIFDTAGFGQWQSSVSLLFGVAAKEVVVATMGTLFTVNGSMLGATLITQLGWTPLVAFSFMVFALLYTPCFATLMTIRSETNSWKWTIFSAVYPFVVAWIVATLIFQIGSLFI